MVGTSKQSLTKNFTTNTKKCAKLIVFYFHLDYQNLAVPNWHTGDWSDSVWRSEHITHAHISVHMLHVLTWLLRGSVFHELYYS